MWPDLGQFQGFFSRFRPKNHGAPPTSGGSGEFSARPICAALCSKNQKLPVFFDLGVPAPYLTFSSQNPGKPDFLPLRVGHQCAHQGGGAHPKSGSGTFSGATRDRPTPAPERQIKTVLATYWPPRPIPSRFRDIPDFRSRTHILGAPHLVHS